MAIESKEITQNDTIKVVGDTGYYSTKEISKCAKVLYQYQIKRNSKRIKGSMFIVILFMMKKMICLSVQTNKNLLKVQPL